MTLLKYMKMIIELLNNEQPAGVDIGEQYLSLIQSLVYEGMKMKIKSQSLLSMENYNRLVDALNNRFKVSETKMNEFDPNLYMIFNLCYCVKQIDITDYSLILYIMNSEVS